MKTGTIFFVSVIDTVTIEVEKAATGSDMAAMGRINGKGTMKPLDVRRRVLPVRPCK